MIYGTFNFLMFWLSTKGSVAGHFHSHSIPISSILWQTSLAGPSNPAVGVVYMLYACMNACTNACMHVYDIVAWGGGGKNLFGCDDEPDAESSGWSSFVTTTTDDDDDDDDGADEA